MRGLLIATVLSVLHVHAIDASEYSTGEPPWDREQRAKLAEKWAPGFELLLESIPVLSPAEAKWLKSEEAAAFKAKSSERLINVSSSKENHIHQVRANLAIVVHALREIRRADIELRTEILHWSMFARELMRPPLWDSLFALVRMKLVSPARMDFMNGTGADEYLTRSWAAGNAGTILDQVVTPYLDGRLP